MALLDGEDKLRILDTLSEYLDDAIKVEVSSSLDGDLSTYSVKITMPGEEN